MEEHTAAAPLRVLIVDDSADTQESLALLLRLWGFDPAMAGDGAAALDLAAAWRPDVVLLDLGLPGMDGWEAARRLRRLPCGTQPLLIVSVSGYTAEEDRRRALEAGCDMHWAKPVDPADLRRLLNGWKRVREGRCGDARPQGSEPASTVPSPAAAVAAEHRLRANIYPVLRSIACECRDGVLTLHGRLPSYFLKQLAQESVAGLEGVSLVKNEIEVVQPLRRL